jgi:hypothetical protein
VITPLLSADFWTCGDVTKVEHVLEYHPADSMTLNVESGSSEKVNRTQVPCSPSSQYGCHSQAGLRIRGDNTIALNDAANVVGNTPE